MDRKKAPVIIIGSPRSGNNLMFHMLLSSGGFAIYRAASFVFNTLVPRFGDLSVLENRREMMKMWLASPFFTRSGLDRSIEEKVLAKCRNGGDFLRIIMEEMCARQKIGRWAYIGVEEMLYLREIKRTIPDALFIHVIRDGRDVALSLGKIGYIKVFPWDRKRRDLTAAFYWNWIIRKGRKYGRAMGNDYLEIRYENLVSAPREVLARIGEFIGEELDYERIREAAVGTLAAPNTSFDAGSGESAPFRPVGRWKTGYSSSRLKLVEGCIGPLLRELGYEVAEARRTGALRLDALDQRIYEFWFAIKLWLKTRTPLARRLVNVDTLLDEAAFKR